MPWRAASPMDQRTQFIADFLRDALSITAYTGGGHEDGLRTATRWFLVGLPLVLVYFVVVFRLHRGKAVAARDGEGY